MIKSIVKFSQLENRLDAEYYKPEFLEFHKKITKLRYNRIKKFQYFNQRGIQPVYNDSGKYKVLTSKFIGKNCINYEELPSVVEKLYNFNKKLQLRVNDIVTYTTGAYVGQTQPWLNTKIKAIASNHVNILRVKNIDPLFVSAIVISKIGQEQVRRLVSGAAQAELYPRNLDQMVIPRFSNKIEKDISKKIKISFIKRQLAKQKYEEAKKLLEDYLKIDESDLKFNKTFSTKFSEIENRLDPEYYQPRFNEIKKVLDRSGYKLVKLGDISSAIRYGTSDKVIYKEKGVPFLRVTDVDEFFTIEPEKGKFISKIEAEKLKKYAVKGGEIIISRTGTLGSAIYINSRLDGSIFGSYFIKVSPESKELLPEFIAFYLNSLLGKLQTEKRASGGIQTNLTVEMIKSYTILVLPQRIQKKICNLYSEALQNRKKSKQLLEEAKQKVEDLLEKGGEKANKQYDK